MESNNYSTNTYKCAAETVDTYPMTHPEQSQFSPKPEDKPKKKGKSKGGKKGK